MSGVTYASTSDIPPPVYAAMTWKRENLLESIRFNKARKRHEYFN